MNRDQGVGWKLTHDNVIIQKNLRCKGVRRTINLRQDKALTQKSFPPEADEEIVFTGLHRMNNPRFAYFVLAGSLIPQFTP
jgi:hypothetical protein